MGTYPTKEELLKQERELTFARFGLDDAYKLGCLLYETGREQGERYAVRVKLGDLTAFQALMPGTSADNVVWMDRKCATVERTGHCSLWAFVDHEEAGDATQELADDKTCALYGGGFPLVSEGKRIGVVALSGMPHLEDHRRLTSTLARFRDLSV